MNILITGGLGFIGSHLAERLLNDNHHISIISKNKIIPNNLKKIESRLSINHGDYGDKKTLENIAINKDIIIHAACTTVPENSTHNPIYDIESNVLPTLGLIQEAIKQGVKKFIYLSSGGVIYGNVNSEIINEYNLTQPISSYGITKLMIEKYLYMYNKIDNFNYISLRISNAYGPEQLYKNNQGVISNWIKKAKSNLPLEIWGNEKTARDYIYIDDITEAIASSIQNNINGEFNVGTGKGTSLIDLANIIIKLTNSSSQIKINSSNSRKFDILNNILDYSKFQKKTGWYPKIYIDEGIKRCL